MGFDTEYVVMANPHSEAPKAEFSINLEAIFDGGDPFASKEDAEAEAKAAAEFEGK